MTNYVYIATSLDGFIAADDGSIDWLDATPNPENSDFGYADFMNRIDALVMGRKTFEKVLTFGVWPYGKPVFVLTSSMVEVPHELEGKIELINRAPPEVVTQLKELGHHNLYIDGGITIQGFLEDDLIDEMIITRIPILLGNGIPLFGELTRRLHFKHKSTEILNEMLVKSHYIRVRKSI